MNSRFTEGPLLRVAADIDVPKLAEESVLHIATARVLVADYEVIQHDFAELSTENLTLLNPQLDLLDGERRRHALHALIDDWLLHNAAFISTAQAAQCVVNTPIEVDGRSKVAYRPPRYGRAVVVPLCQSEMCHPSLVRSGFMSAGLLDLKGAGVAPTKIPTNGHQSSGLEYLAVALSDFILKKAIDEIFARGLSAVSTVPVYAVLDLGFDVCGGFFGTGAAGMHVRRAHRRPIEGVGTGVDRELAARIESVLRRYGITTATKGFQLHIAATQGRVSWQVGDNSPFDLVDPRAIGVSLSLLERAKAMRLIIDRPVVQLMRNVSSAGAQMVDFGHLRVESSFAHPFMCRYSGAVIENIVWPDSREFVRPDPAVALPPARWDRRQLAASCSDVIERFRTGKWTRGDVEGFVDNLLQPLSQMSL
jgi:hypothetical protein